MKNGSIALCRVSTSEQKEGGSLPRQAVNVKNTATLLDAPIEREWSLDVSSRVGKNLKRKDLMEMLDYCKKNKNIKYLIVDEVDRFMRDITYFYYFEATFDQLGVKVYYASQPELNSGDMMSKLQKLFLVFRAEASNDERRGKSMNGLVDSVRRGYHPFPLLPGYMKSSTPALHIPDPNRFPLLQESIRRILSGQFTVNEACAWLKDQGYLTLQGKVFGIDKFKEYLKNPFIAGAVCPKTWNKEQWNWKALHQPMISLEEWERLQPLVDKNKRVFTRKKHNPQYQMSNLMHCDACKEGRLVGFNHRNGKGWVGEKYRCRKCLLQFKKSDVHTGLDALLQSIELREGGIEEFLGSLRTVWLEDQSDNLRQVGQQEGLISKLIEQKMGLSLPLLKTQSSKKTLRSR
jgi:DNA invertase Pin-like site-specific DNA recombinase